MKFMNFVLLAGLAAFAKAATTNIPAGTTNNVPAGTTNNVPAGTTNVPAGTGSTAGATGTPPAPSPTTACAGCQGKASIDALFNKFNFSGGCTVYQQAYTCSQKCPGVSDALTAYVGEMCVATTGVVSICGQKIKSCVSDLMDANAAAVAKNQKTLCSDIAMFFQCSTDALVKCHSQNATAMISQLTAAVSELDMESGCNGRCAAGVGACMAGLTRDVTAGGTMNATLFKNMCQQLGSATTCINPLKATVCANTQTGIQLADNSINKAKQQLSDLCDSDGNPTACATGFMTCGNGLKNITAANGCKVMSTYLTCAERLNCKYSIEDNIKAEVKNITAAQKLSGCSTVGGCQDRIKQCAAKAKTLLSSVTNNTDINQFCNMSQTIEQCFIVVRQDPNCKYENLEASDDESKFFQMFGSQCGNATACSKSITQCKADYANVTASTPTATKCVAVGKAVKCLSQMLNSDICVRVGQKAQADDKSLAGNYTQDCGNPSLCDQGIKACYQPIKDHHIISDPDSKKVSDCPIITSAVNCMDKMANSQTCKIFTKSIDASEATIRQMESGFCNTAGSCDTSIVACKKDYKNIPAGADTLTRCNAVGLAVTCINQQLKSPICANAGKQANDEDKTLANMYNQTCGNPTLCDTELNSCFKAIVAKIGMNITTKQDCPDIKTALKCIDTTSKAWACKLESQDMSGGAAVIRAKDKAVCGGRGVNVQASIFLIVLGLLTHFFKKF